MLGKSGVGNYISIDALSEKVGIHKSSLTSHFRLNQNLILDNRWTIVRLTTQEFHNNSTLVTDSAEWSAYNGK